jgi:hypothetical protein
MQRFITACARALHVKKFDISSEQYLRLIRYIDNSLKTDANGHVINIKTAANYEDHDAFYEAKRRYNLFTLVILGPITH